VPSNYRPGWGAPGYRPGGPQPRYDPRYFPRNYRPARTYAWRGSAWRPQPGFYYRRWAYGDRLPFGWFGPQWYIDDYYYYDLPVPPYGYEWVRVGPDALLVDLDSGAVVSAVYGLFY
jgi:Ni/Co efflux regulator RcnB